MDYSEIIEGIEAVRQHLEDIVEDAPTEPEQQDHIKEMKQWTETKQKDYDPQNQMTFEQKEEQKEITDEHKPDDPYNNNVAEAYQQPEEPGPGYHLHDDQQDVYH